MFFYELYPDTIGDTIPTLPVNQEDVVLFGLGMTRPLTWENVCSIALEQGAYRQVSSRIPRQNGQPSVFAVKHAIHAVALAHASEYAAMRAAIDVQYDPVENYNMYETSTTDYEGSQTTTTQQTSADSRTVSASAAQDKTTTPEQCTTNVEAAAQTTASTQHDVVGFDGEAADFKPESRDTSTNTTPELTTTTTTQALEQTTDYGARTSTEQFTAGDRQATTSFDGRTDTTTLHRHGNIGVTTSQQLIESELILRAKLNLAERVARDILAGLCIANYNFSDLFGGRGI